MSKNFLIQKLQGRVSTCLNVTNVSLEQHFTALIRRSCGKHGSEMSSSRGHRVPHKHKAPPHLCPQEVKCYCTGTRERGEFMEHGHWK